MGVTSHEALAGGARLFDDGRFFEAHEAWEQHWRAESDPERRRLLQGLIQIAAALHKLLNLGAPDSASRLFSRGLAKLDACPTSIGDLGLGAFCEAVRAFARAATRDSLGRPPVPTFGPVSPFGPRPDNCPRQE
jgi:predicted metal-dependent hydrolase